MPKLPSKEERIQIAERNRQAEEAQEEQNKRDSEAQEKAMQEGRENERKAAVIQIVENASNSIEAAIGAKCNASIIGHYAQDERSAVFEEARRRIERQNSDYRVADIPEEICVRAFAEQRPLKYTFNGLQLEVFSPRFSIFGGTKRALEDPYKAIILVWQ